MMQKWMTVLDLILLDVLSGGSLVWLMSMFGYRSRSFFTKRRHCLECGTHTNWAKGVKISDEKYKSVVERSD